MHRFPILYGIEHSFFEMAARQRKFKKPLRSSHIGTEKTESGQTGITAKSITSAYRKNYS
jgi:hypothetical protein